MKKYEVRLCYYGATFAKFTMASSKSVAIANVLTVFSAKKKMSRAFILSHFKSGDKITTREVSE